MVRHFWIQRNVVNVVVCHVTEVVLDVQIAGVDQSTSIKSPFVYLLDSKNVERYFLGIKEASHVGSENLKFFEGILKRHNDGKFFLCEVLGAIKNLQIANIIVSQTCQVVIYVF